MADVWGRVRNPPWNSTLFFCPRTTRPQFLVVLTHIGLLTTKLFVKELTQNFHPNRSFKLKLSFSYQL